MRRLFHEYLTGAPDLMAFYAKAPGDLFETSPEPADWDPALVTALRAYQREIGATGTFEGTEPVVITGQQPSLFAGPLYSIYKAATTILLAERLERKFGMRCAPVYWVGSEDHDFEEARTARFLTKQHQLLTCTYHPSQPVDGMPMYRVPLESSLHEMVDLAAEETPGSEFRESIREFLHESLDVSTSLAGWTARLLARLFEGSRLIFFAPHLEAARVLGKPIIERELAEPLAAGALVNEAARKLDALGFPPQLVKNEDECSFFLDVEGRRRKVMFDGKTFHLPEEELSFTRQELEQCLNDEPGRFSPNVALRCIVQQHLFPAAAYVAGPGEIAYWAQLKSVFERFGKTMPVVYPRAQCALTTIKLNKLRNKLGLELEDLEAPREDVIQRVIRNTSQDPAFRFVRDKRATLENLLEELRAGLLEHDKTASGVAEGLAKKMSTQMDRLERVLLQKEETRDGVVKQQVDRLVTALAPGRGRQERVYTIFSFLFEHGWELVPRLLRELDPESFRLQEIEL